MTRFSEVAERPVMSTDAARTVGIVTGFVIDPDSKRVIALRLTKTPASGDTLHWEDLTASAPMPSPCRPMPSSSPREARQPNSGATMQT